MIFKEIINKKSQILIPAFDQLFDMVIKNQVHAGDLLLVKENGFYNPEILNWNNFGKKFLLYTIGPNKELYSEYDHYKFIDSYRKTYEYRVSHDEYLNEIKWVPEKREKINELIFQEKLSIQLEMLVYLKIWESDSFIKRFYQLARLSNGEEYDWHFKIAESNRDKGCTGSRHEIIRKKTRNKFEKNLPQLHSSIKNSYNTQVRNSIAHSKYSFLNRDIHLNNYIENDESSQLRLISFNDWIDKFHETMILYYEYIEFINKIDLYYTEIAKKNNNLIEVKFNMKEPKEKVEYRYLEYRPERNGFIMKLY